MAWVAPVALADAPLALLAVAGLLLGVWFMSRGPRAEAAAGAAPADDAAPAAPAAPGPPVATAAAAQPEPEPEPVRELEELPRTAFRHGTIKLAGDAPAQAEPQPGPPLAEPEPAQPPPVPPTTFRQGSIRLGNLPRGDDEPPTDS